jgi:protein disulfide-isomerase A1
LTNFLIILFRNGEKTEYTGGRTENEIVNWILKRTGPASTESTNCDGVKAKAESAKIAVAFFGEAQSNEFSEYSKAAGSNDKVSFTHLACSECASSFGAGYPSLVLFRKFDNSPLVYNGEWNANTITEWISTSSVPTVIEFSEDFIEPIFGQRKAAVFLFRSAGDADSDFAKTFSEAANALKGSILFVVSGVTEGIQGRLGEFIGVDESQLPTIRLLDPNDNMKKFSFPGRASALTVSDLESFINDFKSGGLKPFLKSQEIPEADGRALKTIVGKNFQSEVIDSDADVFVKFYAPWCGHCKTMAPIWEELATELKDVAHFVIADFDATMNEADGVDVKGFPTLKFYPRGAKGSAPLDYEGERTKEGFLAYIKEHSQAYKDHQARQTEL